MQAASFLSSFEVVYVNHNYSTLDMNMSKYFEEAKLDACIYCLIFLFCPENGGDTFLQNLNSLQSTWPTDWRIGV
jgi:hypothetical protein